MLSEPLARSKGLAKLAMLEADMAERLCPKCGAYWACGCELEVPSVAHLQQRVASSDAASFGQPVDVLCPHDWVDAVGVEHDQEAFPEGTRVLMCRLCGIYAVTAAEEMKRQ
jgi:hypothetical protein